MDDIEVHIGPNVPRADSVVISRCENPECGCPHLILLDEDNQPIAICILSMEQVHYLNRWPN